MACPPGVAKVEVGDRLMVRPMFIVERGVIAPRPSYGRADRESVNGGEGVKF